MNYDFMSRLARGSLFVYDKNKIQKTLVRKVFWIFLKWCLTCKSLYDNIRKCLNVGLSAHTM